MITKIKKLWLKGLRSEKYKQGKEALRKKNNYCCLGVLCDIYRKENKVRWKKFDDADGYYSLFNDGAVLPSKVRIWSGLKHSNPKILLKSLSEYNDTGKTFKEIANLIEKYL